MKEFKIDSVDDFKQEIGKYGDKVVIVDFHATWCGPCKMIAPKLKEIEKSMEDQVILIKVDVDKCEDVAQKYEVTAMPTIILFKGGEKVGETIVGANEQKIRSAIDQAIASPSQQVKQ